MRRSLGERKEEELDLEVDKKDEAMKELPKEQHNVNCAVLDCGAQVEEVE